MRRQTFVAIVLLTLFAICPGFSQPIKSLKINEKDIGTSIDLADTLLLKIEVDTSFKITNENKLNAFNKLKELLSIYVYNMDDLDRNPLIERNELKIIFSELNFKLQNGNIYLPLNTLLDEGTHGKNKFNKGLNSAVFIVFKPKDQAKTLVVLKDKRFTSLYNESINDSVKLFLSPTIGSKKKIYPNVESKDLTITDFNYTIEFLNNLSNVNQLKCQIRFGNTTSPLIHKTPFDIKPYESIALNEKKQFSIDLDFYIGTYKIISKSLTIFKQGNSPSPEYSNFIIKIDNKKFVDNTEYDINSTLDIILENHISYTNSDKLNVKLFVYDKDTPISAEDLSKLKPAVSSAVKFEYDNAKHSAKAIVPFTKYLINDIERQINCNNKKTNLICVFYNDNQPLNRFLSASAFRIQLVNQSKKAIVETVSSKLILLRNETAIPKDDWNNIFYMDNDNFRIKNTTIDNISLKTYLINNKLELIHNETSLDIENPNNTTNPEDGKIQIELKDSNSCVLKAWNFNAKKTPQIEDLFLVQKGNNNRRDSMKFITALHPNEIDQERKTFSYSGDLCFFYNNKLVASGTKIFDKCQLIKINTNGQEESIFDNVSNVTVLKYINEPKYKESWTTYKLIVSNERDPSNQVVVIFRFTSSWKQKYEFVNGISAAYTFLIGDDKGNIYNSSATALSITYRLSPKKKRLRFLADLFLAPGIEIQLPYKIEDKNTDPANINSQSLGLGIRNNFLFGAATISGGYTFGNYKGLYWSLGIDPILLFNGLREKILAKEYYKW